MLNSRLNVDRSISFGGGVAPSDQSNSERVIGAMALTFVIVAAKCRGWIDSVNIPFRNHIYTANISSLIVALISLLPFSTFEDVRCNVFDLWHEVLSETFRLYGIHFISRGTPTAREREAYKKQAYTLVTALCNGHW